MKKTYTHKCKFEVFQIGNPFEFLCNLEETDAVCTELREMWIVFGTASLFGVLYIIQIIQKQINTLSNIQRHEDPD